MWTYSQTNGKLTHDGALVGFGYAGNGAWKDNPLGQALRGRGPLPQGKYTISTAYHDEEEGPLVMSLHPDPENQMFGRGGFRIHGDSIHQPGTASKGCIIVGPVIRKQIAESTDRALEVVA